MNVMPTRKRRHSGHKILLHCGDGNPWRNVTNGYSRKYSTMVMELDYDHPPQPIKATLQGFIQTWGEGEAGGFMLSEMHFSHLMPTVIRPQHVD